MTESSSALFISTLYISRLFIRMSPPSQTFSYLMMERFLLFTTSTLPDIGDIKEVAFISLATTERDIQFHPSPRVIVCSIISRASRTTGSWNEPNTPLTLKSMSRLVFTIGHTVPVEASYTLNVTFLFLSSALPAMSSMTK